MPSTGRRKRSERIMETVVGGATRRSGKRASSVFPDEIAKISRIQDTYSDTFAALSDTGAFVESERTHRERAAPRERRTVGGAPRRKKPPRLGLPATPDGVPTRMPAGRRRPGIERPS